MRAYLLASFSIVAFSVAGIAQAQTAPTIAIRDISSGQTVNSRMDASDPVLSADNSPFEIFKVRVRAGQIVTATMNSSAFQPTMSLGNVQNADICEDCSYPASGEDQHVSIARKTIDSDGFLYIRTNTMLAGDSGDYSLKVEVANAPRVVTTRINYGHLVQGNLAQTDSQNDEGNYQDIYSVRLRAGQHFQIDASSEAIDPIIKLHGPNSEGVVAELESDDDSGPGLNSRIRYTATRAGEYRINISSIGETKTGAYTLLIGDEPPRTALPAPIALNIGGTATGSLAENSPKEEAGGEEVAYVRYQFTGAAAKAYIINVDSTEIDTVVEVGKYNKDGDFESINSDDDGGEGTNSLLRFKLEDAGSYIIRVHALPQSEESQNGLKDFGTFTIGLKEAVNAPTPQNATPITLGQNVTGRLTEGGPRTGDDKLYNIYSINLVQGQKVTISMNKLDADGDNIDPFLELGTGTPANFTKITEDDDGGSGLNSRIRFEAPANGAYLIRAEGIDASNAGSYTLNVSTTQPPPPAPAPIAINIGETKTDSLKEGDAFYGDDELKYKLYSFEARAGETYVIEMNSSDFDSFVDAKALSAADTAYASDDDGGGELNSKLEFTVATTGRQIIRAHSLSSDGLGSFTLKLSRK